MKKILIIASHPDDEILGCGGTVARLVKEGYEAYTLILGEGITSRDYNRNVNERKNEIDILRKNIYKANKIIGVKEVFIENLPDNRFDSLDLLDIVKMINNYKEKIEPDIIFTHYEKDLNVDHQITYNAVLTATRPMKNETVKEIYSFEILSSTEWNYPLSFSPNIFIDISDYINLKINAMKEYKGELRKYPHPRSIEGIKILAQNNGLKTGLEYAECFKLVRKII